MPVKDLEQISQRAFELWEREGRPEGRDVAHWLQAEAEATAIAVPETAEPQPRRRKAAAPVAEVPVVEAKKVAPKKPAAKKAAAAPEVIKAKAPAKPRASRKA